MTRVGLQSLNLVNYRSNSTNYKLREDDIFKDSELL